MYIHKRRIQISEQTSEMDFYSQISSLSMIADFKALDSIRYIEPYVTRTNHEPIQTLSVLTFPEIKRRLHLDTQSLSRYNIRITATLTLVP